MEFHGNITMLQNFLQQAALSVETNFPATPVVGRVVFKDQRVYICVEIQTGIPVWVPLTNEIASYVHAQSPGDTTWVINHNLNTTTPAVQVYGTDGKSIIPDEIVVNTNNQITITFGISFAGRAIVLTGSAEGAKKTNYAFEWNQTSLATSWVVFHALGYYPITRVFIGQQEVQPASILHDSVMQTTITFSTPQVGVARFV